MCIFQFPKVPQPGSQHAYEHYFEPPRTKTAVRVIADRWKDLAFGIDVSRYQKITAENWKNLKSLAKIDFVFAKASESTDWLDPSFADTVQQCHDVGLPLMAYHFFRTSYYVEFGHDTGRWPKPADDKQLQNLIKALKNKTYYAVVIDVEDTTETYAWTAWAAGIFAGRVKDWLISVGKPNVPVITYTGEWYWKNAKDEFAWTTKYLLWVAKYPYATGSVVTTWDELRNAYFPAATTSIPTLGNLKWDFWQFSGDKFILPFVTNPNGFASALDLNFFNGTREQLYKLLNFVPKDDGDDPETPPTTDPDLVKRVERLERVLAAMSSEWSKEG